MQKSTLKETIVLVGAFGEKKGGVFLPSDMLVCNSGVTGVRGKKNKLGGGTVGHH